MKRCIVTITDNIASTSMPFNEFVLYRRDHYPLEKQIVILLFKDKVNSNIKIPDGLELYCIGKQKRQLKEIINSIVNLYDDVIFHIHEAKSVLLFNYATAGKYKHRIVYTLHSTYKNYPFHNKLFCQIASRCSKYVVCVSKTSYKYYPSNLKVKLEDRVLTIQNGVDTERIDNINKIKKIQRKYPIKVVYVARLVPLKRHDMLLDIISRVNNVELWLIGDGNLLADLRRKAIDLKIQDRVTFYGSMKRDEVYEKLLEADIYVSTSSYEGLPISVLEAMRCGLPCVLSNIEQHREISEKCRSLKLIEDNDEMWVQALEGLISEPLKRDSDGKNNYQEVAQYFSLEVMHKQYDKIYDKL